MRDPSDTRDIGPRIGSPFWIYLTVVTVAGLGALVAALLHGPSLASLRGLAGHGLFWVLVALSVLGELKPIVTPGKSSHDAGVASVTFCFAALLYWGFPVAAGLRAITTMIVALSGRKAAVPLRVQRRPVHAQPGRGRGGAGRQPDPSGAAAALGAHRR